MILRYLLRDHPVMSEEAKEVILSGAQTTPEVLAEVVYVLKGVYQVSRADIAKTLVTFLQEVALSSKPALTYACLLYGKTSLDFVDCILAGYHHMEEKTIATFDKKLLKALKDNLLSEE